MPCALAVLSLALPALIAWRAAFEIPTMHIDGAFQTFSGLQRLQAGQLPGADFFTYLGAGPLLALFPSFVLAGGDLAASVFAATFMTLIAAEVVVAMVFLLAFGRHRWRIVMLAPPILMVAVWVLIPRYWWELPALTGMVTPGNSLRPIRALAPYLLALLSVIVVATGWRPRTVLVILGVAAGAIGATWSNDYGLVSMAVWLVGITAYAIRSRRWRWTDVLGAWVAAAIGFVVVGLIVTRASFVEYLGYAFVDVRGDQFWYFGPWEEARRIFGPGDLAQALRADQALLGAVWLAGLTAYSLWKPDLRRGVLAAIGATLFLGGTVSTVGGHIGGYYVPFTAWAVVSVVAVVAAVLHDRFLRSQAGIRFDRAVVTALAVVVVLVATAAGWQMYREADVQARALVGNPRYVLVDELGGYVDAAWADHVRQAATFDDVVEEYAGLVTALGEPNTTLRVDSVIHALGRQRDEFTARMAGRPEKVVTTAPGYNEWVTWGLSANWWFYRDLFAGYEPQITSPSTVVWTRVDPVAGEPVGCRIEGSDVVLEAPSAGLYEVSIDYAGPGRGARAFSMVRNGINAPLDAGGYVALDPGATSQSVPVAAVAAGDVPLDIIDRPSGAQPLTTLQGCSANRVTVPAGSQALSLYADLLRAGPE